MKTSPKSSFYALNRQIKKTSIWKFPLKPSDYLNTQDIITVLRVPINFLLLICLIFQTRNTKFNSSCIPKDFVFVTFPYHLDYFCSFIHCLHTLTSYYQNYNLKIANVKLHKKQLMNEMLSSKKVKFISIFY